MAKVKYRVREYNPTENQNGTHSFYAEVVILNEINNNELAELISRRTGFKSYECQAIIAAIAEVTQEETLKGNRVSLSDIKGTKLVSFYPKVSGSVSDAEVRANAEKYENAQVATEDMLTPDQLNWTLGATVGVKFSKEFALNKRAQKVKDTASASSSDDDTEETPDGGGDGDDAVDDGNE